MKQMRIGIISLGCSKNLVDSEVILGTLQRRGYLVSDHIQGADVVIVNTCTFIKDATEESIDAILETIELKKARKIRALIVAGCLPQRYWWDNLAQALDEVDAFIGVGQYHRIVEVIEKIFLGEPTHVVRHRPGSVHTAPTTRYPLTPQHFAYVKISEGCNNRCTYCIIPQVRGSHRSRRMQSIIEEVQRLSNERSLAEINLVGQDTTMYGTDLYGHPRIAKLLRKLARLKNVTWIRLLYTHPAHFDSEVIDVIRDEPSVCNYVDLPLQHIHDAILQAMGRNVTRRHIETLIESLRVHIPHLTLRTTFIVGFPGETEQQFQELLDFVKDVRFERLGAFTYSREEHTPAYTYPGQIPEKEKKERHSQLMKIQREISREKNRALVGTEFDVLLDSQSTEDPTLFLARTEADAPEVDQLVYVRSPKAEPGAFITVKITDAYEYDLVGEPVRT